MQRYILLGLCLSGCAGIGPDDLQRASTARVCYVGAVSPEYRDLARAELERRKEGCDRHAAEIRAIHEDVLKRAAERQAEEEQLYSMQGARPRRINEEPRRMKRPY